MSTKICSYKNCENINTKNPELTFFRFPIRYENKCTAWSFLSGCGDTNLKNKYLCEAHFDPIHMSKTPRRTALLPNAMPYLYCDISNDTTSSIIIEHVDGSEQENEESDDEHLMRKKRKLSDDCLIISSPDPLQVTEIANKKAADDARQSISGEKRSACLSNGDCRESKSNEHSQFTSKTEVSSVNDSFDNTKDNQDVSTFIYKGEEYIQMPKRIFMEERNKMLATIAYYKCMVKKIKQIINKDDS